MIGKTFKFIEDENEEGLRRLLNDNKDVPVNEIVDNRGYTLLHEATFHDCGKLVRVIIRHGRMTLTPPKLSDWIDASVCVCVSACLCAWSDAYVHVQCPE